MQKKLLISYIVIISALTLTILSVVFNIIRNTVRSNVVSLAEQSLKNECDLLSSIITFGEKSALSISIDETVQKTLRELSLDDEADGASLFFYSGALQSEYFKSTYSNFNSILYYVEICSPKADGSFQVVYSTERRNTPPIDSYAAATPWLTGALSRNGRFFWSIVSDDGKSYFLSSRIGSSSFYLIGIKNLQEVYDEFRGIVYILLSMAIAVAVVPVVISIALSKSITQPLRNLSETMAEVKNGDLDLSVSSRHKREIGTLYSSFNHMIEMIQTLI